MNACLTQRPCQLPDDLDGQGRKKAHEPTASGSIPTRAGQYQQEQHRQRHCVSQGPPSGPLLEPRPHLSKLCPAGEPFPPEASYAATVMVLHYGARLEP